MTPFEKAGYTKETKFKVLRDDCIFNKGDIVTLDLDNDCTFPWFKTEDGKVHCVYLPNMTPEGYDDWLEVYEGGT